MEKPILASFLSCSGYKLTDDEKYILEKSNPLGMVLFGRNIKNKSQINELTNEIKTIIGRSNVLIAIDQEGGRVQRLTTPEFRSYGAQIDIGKLSVKDARKASKLHAELISDDLYNIGINVNFAPCLDRLHNNTTEALKSRCFSDNVNTISELGKIMVETYIKNGILPCIKHLPGHGLASIDPHLGLPIINASENDIKTELIPFKNCNFAPLAMTAHICIPYIDTKNPITQSKHGIEQLIRQEIGFNGLLISDAVDMHALKGPLTEKAKKSIEAGCDCICYSMGKIEDLQELSKNCPKLSDAGIQRLDKALQILHNNNRTKDIHKMSYEYTNLLTQITPYVESYDATEVLHKLQTKE